MEDRQSLVVKNKLQVVQNLFTVSNGSNECPQPTRNKLAKGQTCLNHHFLYNLSAYIMIMVDGRNNILTLIQPDVKNITFF